MDIATRERRFARRSPGVLLVQHDQIGVLEAVHGFAVEAMSITDTEACTSAGAVVASERVGDVVGSLTRADATR